MGSGCGLACRAVASNTRGPEHQLWESRHCLPQIPFICCSILNAALHLLTPVDVDVNVVNSSPSFKIGDKPCGLKVLATKAQGIIGFSSQWHNIILRG